MDLRVCALGSPQGYVTVEHPERPPRVRIEGRSEGLREEEDLRHPLACLEVSEDDGIDGDAEQLVVGNGHGIEQRDVGLGGRWRSAHGDGSPRAA